MAEDLHDGEFWLPSQILTDDDILMDFDFSTTAVSATVTTTTTHHGSCSSISDIEFTSFAETESDEDDILLAGLTRSSLFLQDSSNRQGLSKGYGVLSSSPQSTLCGYICHQSSSRESVSPPPPQTEDNNKSGATATTLDLLNKAAGEVARLKISTERKAGTGFFDCSKNGVVAYPPPLKNVDNFPPPYYQPQSNHFPSMVLTPSKGQQTKQKDASHATKSDDKSNTKNNNNRPLGLPPSAWPPLQAQPLAQPQPQPQPLTGVLPKGTGFFMPRLVATPADQPSKKSDGITTKLKGDRRNSGKTSTTDHNDIQLPQEWIY